MKSITTVVAILLLINLVRSDVPDLPQQFKSNVQATLPFMGTLPGVLYYDYPNLKQRLDMSQWGQNMIFIYRYDLGVEYQIMGGQCQSQPLTDELYPMSIPPFATYSGTKTVNNKLTYDYTVDLFGQVTINYFVTNTTTDNKETWTIVRFAADVAAAGITIQYDYSNLVAGPQDPSLFDYTKYNCPSPTPPVVYSVSGYVKSATTNGVLPGITVKLDSASTTTDSNGQYTFSGVAPGVHTVSVPANTKYYGDSLTLNVTGDIPAGTRADFSLSPVLQSGQWRAVLTWGAFPSDLDSYFITSYNCKVYYGNRYCQSGNAVAQLDVDDRNGYGPETITLNSVSGCYVVNNYSKNGYFPQSNARVQIFNSQGLQKDIHVDTTGYNANALNWKVFCLDISQSNPLTIVNSYY